MIAYILIRFNYFSDAMVTAIFAVGKLKRLGYRLLQEAGYVEGIHKRKIREPPIIVDGM